MSRKHHTKHHRTPGGYARRLAKVGLTRTPVMRWTNEPTDKIARDLKIMRERDEEERKRRFPGRSRYRDHNAREMT